MSAPLEHQSRLELWRSVLDSELHALKGLTLINGGAAVALLAFLGNVANHGLPTASVQQHGGIHVSIGGMRWAMIFFVGGVAAATFSSVCRYFVQYGSLTANNHQAIAEQLPPPQQQRPVVLMRRWRVTAFTFQVAAVAAGLASLVAFAWGGWQAYRAVW